MAEWQRNLESKLDYERLEWRKRIVAMADFLDSEDRTVMDLGAGNMHLRGFLDGETKYIPVDYKKTADDTVICDFNKEAFPDIKADAIVASGILEYMDCPFVFLDKICSSCSKLIISYKGKEKYHDMPLYSQEIIDYLSNKGFALTGINHSLEEWTLLGCFEKITPAKLSSQVKCTGCGACVNACSIGALTIKMDEDGFYKPFFDVKKCIGCNKCIEKCPILNDVDDSIESMRPQAFAVWAKDSVRMNSSSGGVFYELAKCIIEAGGIVYATRWSDDFVAYIDSTDDLEELHYFMHSKYVQSNVGNSYQFVLNDLKKSRKVLFVGTPCQIKGLNSFLRGQNIEDLITIDLACFGVPSNGVFQQYLNDNFDKKKINDIIFRDKSKCGWSSYGYRINMKDGSSVFPSINDDCYQQAFHNVLFRNETCEQCDYYKLPRAGDFTIGDFWGIDIHDSSWNDEKGTSLVLINSEKSQLLWNDLSKAFARVEQVPIEWCANKGNRVVTNARSGHRNRAYFKQLLKTNTFNESVKKALSNKHDIGLVCLMNYNIGNNLTNYALYSYLKKIGYSVLMVNVPSSAEYSQYHELNGETFYFMKDPYDSHDVLRAKDKYELYKLSDVCATYIVGPDQLWRESFIKGMDFHTLLEWVPSYKYKFSYGTSVGVSYEEGFSDITYFAKYMISRFDSISVRENFAKKKLEKEYGTYAEVVMDPVFLCDKSFYETMAKSGKHRTLNGKYVAAYFLDPSEQKERALLDLANEKTNGRYMVMTEPTYKKMHSELLKYTLEPGVEEWLAMMANSDCIITDSFHGMCFALIFNKPFCVTYSSDNWRGIERFQDLLERINLQELLCLDDYSDLKAKIEEADFESAYQMISDFTLESKEWLKKELSKAKLYRGSIELYDIFFKQLSEIKDAQKEQDKRLEVQEEDNKKLFSKVYLQERLLASKSYKPKGKTENMNVVLWGAGDCFRRNIEIVKKYIDVRYVCDNNIDLWGTTLGGDIVCISPETLANMKNVMVVIMIENASVCLSVIKQLNNLGIFAYEHVYNWLAVIERK